MMNNTRGELLTPEFDEYAPTYSDLLRDPIRDRFAGDVEFFHRRKWWLIRDFLAQNEMTPSRMSWLDVGCGRGELLSLAGGEFFRAAGCDPSPEMIKDCAGREIRQQASPGELPFEDSSFDLITAVCVYHHVWYGERSTLTQSICRVLKPGGLFCVIEHNPWNPVTQLIVKGCPVDVDAQLLTASNTARIMCSANLKIIETVYFLYLPQCMFKVLGWIEKTPAARGLPLGGQFAVFSRKASTH